jgi:hypothetical protein
MMMKTVSTPLSSYQRRKRETFEKQDPEFPADFLLAWQIDGKFFFFREFCQKEMNSRKNPLVVYVPLSI